jgi:hypothetical protein
MKDIGAGMLYSVQRIARRWAAWDSNSGNGKTFSILKNRPDMRWDPHNTLLNGYRGFCAGVKRSGREVDPHLQHVPRLHDFGLPPRSRREMRSSGLLSSE